MTTGDSAAIIDFRPLSRAQFFSDVKLGLAPQALCLRLLRRLSDSLFKAFVSGLILARSPVMYRILQVISTIVILGVAIVLSFILIWLIGAHGVIACGKWVFDSPTWYLDVMLLIGIPLSVIGGSVALYFWCSWRRLRIE